MKRKKNPSVCIGCKYHDKNSAYSDLKGTCAYMEITGHSRLVEELKNGGVQENSCVCYERGSKRGRPRKKI